MKYSTRHRKIPASLVESSGVRKRVQENFPQKMAILKNLDYIFLRWLGLRAATYGNLGFKIPHWTFNSEVIKRILQEF
jgi:hypothetical protein